jgi:hypothetical protein
MDRIAQNPNPHGSFSVTLNNGNNNQTRAAEDILSLTRSMKEAWLFEKLSTVGEDEHDIKRNKELEDNVKYVHEALEEGLPAQSAS